MTESGTNRAGYFPANLAWIVSLLTIWAFVSFGCGIVFAPWLNNWMLPGTQYPLGFWFAQQGSIYIFIALIVFYVVRMKKLERKYDLDD